MAPHEIRRPFKRPAISDQQKRRDLSLLRQQQNRQDAQRQARCLASTVLSLQTEGSGQQQSLDLELVTEQEPESEPETEHETGELDVRQAAKIRGVEARRWFARQLMLPEWMIDVPDRLSQDWYVFARPAGKRCFVVSSNGTTVSRLRNGSLLHRFPSALPSGAKTKGNSCSAQSYCILDCIFHELDQTYYVIDLVCWAGYSLYECTAEFRFFWLSSKLVESGACEPPSFYHKYRHAHYQAGNTPLALVWKDEKCSQYVIDTDSKGQIPNQQQVVLELQYNGKLTTSDDPPVIFGCLDMEFMQKSGLRPENLLRFAVSDGGLNFVDGRLEKADLQYIGKANRARAFADSYSKVMFQYTVRHSPLRIEHLLSSISSSSEDDSGVNDMEMVG